MTDLKNLFDFQKIAGNSELDSVIRSVENKYFTEIDELSDDQLEMAAGGKNGPGRFYAYSDKETERNSGRQNHSGFSIQS